MADRSLTKVWLESPLFQHVLEMLPSEVLVVIAAVPPQAPWSNADTAQAMLASSLVRYNGALMDACPQLRVIARTGIGVDNVVIPDATERGIVVINTPDGPTESTAEQAVAMLLGLAKRIKQGGADLAAGRWSLRAGPLMGDEVLGKTVGLVGLGRIGRRVAQICRLAFSMRVLAYDPMVSAEEAAALGVESVTLETVLRESNFVSLHAPALPETFRLMNRERFALMRKGTYFINVSRGTLVDEAALLEALESGHLAGAGIDVYDPEPPAVDSPLRAHPNVIATPHVASLTFEGRERMEKMAIERVMAFFAGGTPENVINPEVMSTAAFVARGG